MTSNKKEDEKNEKIIRGLLKQPGNRKCINCDILGPQYVCVTFSTFVCTNCCGIHREFTHRVKSVSMAKFTPEEIASLQAGGNERAKEVFFKEWDSQHLKAPDSSNGDKLRSFIKHVYVDRRYTGERSIDKPPRSKMGDKEEPNENRRQSDPHQSSSRSSVKDKERRYSDRPSPSHDVRRSTASDKDNQRYSEYGRNPVTPVIVSNWRREDRFSNGKKSDDRPSPEGEIKPEIKSPDSQNDSSNSSLPAVQPVGDLLGENVMPLQVSEPPSANSSGIAEGAVTQGTTSSDSLELSNGNPIELKEETSLIDFDASFELALTVAVTPDQQSVIGEPVLTELSVPTHAPVSGITSDAGALIPSNGMFPSSSSSDFLFDSLGLTSQGVTVNPAVQAQQASHAVSQAPQPISVPEAQILEANTSRTQELPMDLFTATYPASPYQGPAWQAGPVPNVGLPMQYNSAMSTPTFIQPMQSANPFDANAAASASQAAAFPSISSLHATLPNMAAQGGFSLGIGRPSWMPPHTSSHPSVAPPHGSSIRPPIPGAYMGQQLGQFQNNMPPSRPQGLVSVNPAAPTPNPSLGGNPFG
ncbi:uncharacterized protein LOC141597324 isoform X2 [Silene latifolia]